MAYSFPIDPEYTSIRNVGFTALSYWPEIWATMGVFLNSALGTLVSHSLFRNPALRESDEMNRVRK